MFWCGEPGFKNEPIVPANTAAPAPAGLTPARIMIGMSVAPTAAAQPEALGIAVLTINVTMVQAGMRKIPKCLKGAASNVTKCKSDFV